MQLSIHTISTIPCLTKIYFTQFASIRILVYMSGKITVSLVLLQKLVFYIKNQIFTDLISPVLSRSSQLPISTFQYTFIFYQCVEVQRVKIGQNIASSSAWNIGFHLPPLSVHVEKHYIKEIL